jgi:polygalacturonase
VGESLSRRRIVTAGAVGVASAALQLADAGPAAASPAAAAGSSTDGPTRIFDVRRFGAKGDGVTIDTDAINSAIDAAAAGPGPDGGPGGTVYFPAGTYASYSLHLKSNVAVYLAQNATLLAAAPAGGKGYDAAEPGAGNPYQDYGHSHWHNSLMWGEGLQNVTIDGPGTIDGRGLVSADSQESGALRGNKAISLKLCRNVAIRNITMVNGGHFAILATGVDNLSIDGLTIDTNRDGINIDCCKNVRITNTVVNSPNDDGIVLKSSYALNAVRDTENVIIDSCMVSAYEVGTLVDGTFKVGSFRRGGRIKCGTESNGGFKNVAISNVIFEYCGGLALETVDGGHLEDFTVSNLTMRNVQSPIFLRLGARMRGPAGLAVGALRRVSISNVIAHNADPRYPSTIAGIPNHDVADIRISNVRLHTVGGLTPGDAVANPPEVENRYPEVDMFGVLPAYGFFIRHANGIVLDNVEVRFDRQDTRPAYVIRNAADVDIHRGRADKATGVPTFVLDSVGQFTVTASRPVADAHFDNVGHQEL